MRIENRDGNTKMSVDFLSVVVVVAASGLKIILKFYKYARLH